ncbi:MAG TPA: hypothetical protein VGE40_12855 [Bacilli bacterium]
MRRIEEEQGSFTIEASLVFPIIFITTVSLLFMSMYVYQKVVTYSTAALIAERTAFAWNNSYSNPVTGAFYIHEYDNLYWRNFDDSVSGIFQFLFTYTPTEVKFTAGEEISRESSLPRKKLAKAIQFMPDGYKARITYTHHLFDRKISVQLRSSFKFPAFVESFIGNDTVDSLASSKVIDPVEFIRNINLTRTYLPLITKELNIPQINDLLKKFRNKTSNRDLPVDNYSLSFESHAKAKIYLQKLVKGRSINIRTEEVGKWRVIDALDQDKIAHQAYFGSKIKDKDLAAQLMKDIEILRKGEVNGIVWHFFRRKSDGSIGPSESLEKELLKKGIVIILHD